MRTNLIVIDDFYNNVDSVREFALAQDFYIKGNYPGARTENFINESTKNQIQDIIYPYSGNVTNWMDDQPKDLLHFAQSDNVQNNPYLHKDETSTEKGTGYTGAFQISYASDRSWIHTDDNNNWAGVLYLTPDAPTVGGTGFYRSKINGSIYGQNDNDVGPYGQDKSKWDLVNEVHNIYNRLILFRSDQWHTSMEYFGNDNETGRLTQVFFFNTEQ